MTAQVFALVVVLLLAAFPNRSAAQTNTFRLDSLD